MPAGRYNYIAPCFKKTKKFSLTDAKNQKFQLVKFEVFLVWMV